MMSGFNRRDKLGALVLLVGALGLFFFGPWLQSTFYPVVSDVRISRMTQAEDGSTLVWLTFRKNYDCEFIGLSWYAGGRDGLFTKVPVFFLADHSRDDSDQSRPPGHQSAGPWRIGIPYGQLENSFADVTHQCLLPSRSITPFYN